MPTRSPSPAHPVLTRRLALQAGAIGLLGLGMEHLEPSARPAPPGPPGAAPLVIFIFLSGGLAQHESFDPKPDAPEAIRGEFRPIATGRPASRSASTCRCSPAAATCGRWSAR